VKERRLRHAAVDRFAEHVSLYRWERGIAYALRSSILTSMK